MLFQADFQCLIFCLVFVHKHHTKNILVTSFNLLFLIYSRSCFHL